MTPVSLVLLLQVVDTGVVETILGCRLLIVNLKAPVSATMAANFDTSFASFIATGR